MIRCWGLRPISTALRAAIRLRRSGSGASMEVLYRLRNMPGAEGFAAAWEAAIDQGLEDSALEREIPAEVKGWSKIGVRDCRLLASIR